MFDCGSTRMLTFLSTYCRLADDVIDTLRKTSDKMD